MHSAYLSCKILDIFESYDKYIETAQPTVVFMFVEFIVGNVDCIREEWIYYSVQNTYRRDKHLYKDTTTLSQLGFRYWGKVWNQCKSILTDDETKL